MSKVKRNAPCPCGSGKKYKKCCIDKPIPEVAEISFGRYLDSFWSYEEANEMSTEEIIDKLQSIGINFEKEMFLRDVEKFYSAEQVSEKWFKTFKVTVVDRDEDFPWFAAWILWERLAPTNILSLEQMDDLIKEGIKYFAENDPKSACDVWLSVWDAIKYRVKPGFTDLDYLDKQYRGSFFISNFHQELEHELHNAGFIDPTYFEKNLKYCKEFCSYFPNEDEHIIHNKRRAIAESYLYLKKVAEAKEAFESLIRDYPDNPWSYIAYGDMYCFNKDIIKDLSKAREYFKKALLVAKDKIDREVAEERLKDIEEME